MDRWPHQTQGVLDVTSSIESGEKRNCLTSPTGGGKTLMTCDLIRWAVARGERAVLYTNRKLLTEQTALKLRDAGIQFGVRAAGFDEWLDDDAPVQICSLQTETARSIKSMKTFLPAAEHVFIDECHLQKSATGRQLIDIHSDRGASVTGFTATPVGVSDIYNRLIIAGTVSELRACGALVKCEVYGGGEIDTRDLKPQASGEFSIGDLKKRINIPVVFGYVYDHWKKLNPDARPAIGFGPDVAGSAWFAKLFEEKGVPAAHIDGEEVYVDGKTYGTSREVRDEVLQRYRDGEIKILWNRFVLREGIDIPQCYHGILATPIGSVVSYVQIVGRILRAHPSTPEVILQDHGGNYWRHGSPNADRDWSALWGKTDYRITQDRIESLKSKKEPEPIVCPKCGAVRMKNPECYKCGYRHDKSVRHVIQRSGELRAMTGDIFRPRKVKEEPNTARLWESVFWSFRKTGKTFSQARGYFQHIHHYCPPTNLPLMPINELDWGRKIVDVPFESLTKKPKPAETQGVLIN